MSSPTPSIKNKQSRPSELEPKAGADLGRGGGGFWGCNPPKHFKTILLQKPTLWLLWAGACTQHPLEIVNCGLY